MKPEDNKKKFFEDKKSYKKRLVLGIAPTRVVTVLTVLGIVVLSTVLVGNAAKKDADPAAESNHAAVEQRMAAEEMEPEETTVSAAELERQKKAEEEKKIQEEKDAAVEAFDNLGIVQVSGFLNVREEPNTSADILGKIYGDGACEIVEETDDGWYKITSGGLEGYISAEFVLTGDEAREKAADLVDLRAVIQADALNIRKEPTTESDSVGRVLQDERYLVKSQTDDGWIEINTGYISAEFVELRYCLGEARKLDMREMVVNLYDNMGISNVDSYLNMRDKPSEEGKIIGKMTSKSAGEILETVDGWYKIKSGPVTGYVKSDYILTGNEAKNAAMQAAELMAIVSTDTLNVRSEANTESSIWTQVSNSERYRVLNQLDGWVEIEMDSTTGYVSTDYVDVRYALAEAIKFTPLVETSTGSGSGSGKGGGTAGGSGQQSSSRRVQIANYALQFLGNPYVWGGTSLTKGADCSGFTMAVYKNFGVSLPHHSGSQASKGRAINSSQMRPGDLIFYTNSSGTINHVALYIGNGQVVHASNKKSGIKISTWNYRNPAKIVNVLGD